MFISHADPDFYFGAEVIADAFPDAVFVATPPVIEHIQHSYEGKLKAWSVLGTNLPTRLVELTLTRARGRRAPSAPRAKSVGCGLRM